MAGEYAQTNEQIIAALMASDGPQFALPTVDQAPMMGGGGGPGGAPGGNMAARAGSLLGQGIQGMAPQTPFMPAPMMPGRITPGQEQQRRQKKNATKTEALVNSFAVQNVPQDLRMAEADYMQAGQRMQNATTRRFKGGLLGIGESIFDMVQYKGAKEDFVNSRQGLQDQQVAYQQELAKQEEREWLKRRDEYRTAVVPLLQTNIPMQPGENPEMYAMKIDNIANEGFRQDISIKDLLPDGPAKPTREEFIQNDGSTWQRYRDQDGNVIQGEQWQPSMVKGPSKETTPAREKWQSVTNEDGSQDMVLLSPDAKGAWNPVPGAQIRTKPPTPEEAPALVPYVKAASELKTKVGLTQSAADSVARALPLMMQGGNWSNFTSVKFGTNERSAYMDAKSAVFDLLRSETGAAITDSEVERDVDRYLPVMTDSDPIAKAKLNRLIRKLTTTQNNYLHGYSDLPPDTGIPNYDMSWNTEEDAEEVAAITADLDLEQAYEDSMRKAREAKLKAQQQGE